MAKFPKKLALKLRERETKNSKRSLSLNEDLVDFSSNDYLGFSNNKELFKIATEILSKKGIFRNGASGSRLLTGNHELYEEVELKLGVYFESETALIFNSGYDANIGFFASVPQRNDIVLYDEHIHASIRDGIKMGNAKNYNFKHNDLQDLCKRIEHLQGREPEVDSEIYVVTESVFSMDGDSPDLEKLVDFCQEYGTRLIVDEAHAIGVFGDGGRGLLYQLGIQHKPFARVITFGKAWGCHGAAILCSEDLRTYLINFARSFIYTTGLPPHSLACILAAHRVINAEEGVGKQQRLNRHIVYFRSQIQKLDLGSYFIESKSAVHCCVLRSNYTAKQVANDLRKYGMDVRPILSPSVPEGEERLRFCLHAFNEESQLLKVLEVLKENIVKSPLAVPRD